MSWSAVKFKLRAEKLRLPRHRRSCVVGASCLSPPFFFPQPRQRTFQPMSQDVQPRNGGQILVDALVRNSVDTVYCVPGKRFAPSSEKLIDRVFDEDEQVAAFGPAATWQARKGLARGTASQWPPKRARFCN